MGLERRVLKWRLAIWFRIGTVLSISLLYIVIGFASRGYQRHARIDQAVEGKSAKFLIIAVSKLNENNIPNILELNGNFITNNSM